ncbi:DNA methyltransferase [Ruegeria sp. HKCCC2117]|uniref:site-specific DNA-methyltransferase n=1 Tax=Ruegeria sp. HKCCC2117 TaxID=2682992 RepID=UPI001489364B|nr:DNA methyltransferase [Ruegeria sp. HKCCC2117]
MTDKLKQGPDSNSNSVCKTHSSRPEIPKVELLPTSDLRPYHRNPRRHSKHQIRQIASSIEEFDFIVPIVVDSECCIIAGHGRFEAAKLLGLKSVPVIRAEHLSQTQVRAYRLADNKIAENATWDNDLLRIELTGILDLDVDFDLELTGFDIGEIDIHLGINDVEECETVPAPEHDRPATSRLGDLWVVGDHRLKCGDALDPDSFVSLMAGQKAQMIFTDPPYNVPIGGHVSGLGKTRHREFAMASGEMTKVEFTQFLRASFEQLLAHACETAIHYICMDWRHMGEVLDASEGVFHELKNLCVWGKTNAGMGSFYRSQHELVFVLKSGTGSHINNFGLGERGRHRSNLWTYAGANTFHADRGADLAAHPTVKPIAMVRDAIFDCSQRGGIVLDPFAGAGTTLIAAARAGRRGYGIEIDPHYADLILRRLETETGETAVHTNTGLSFAEMARKRVGGLADV